METTKATIDGIYSKKRYESGFCKQWGIYPDGKAAKRAIDGLCVLAD